MYRDMELQSLDDAAAFMQKCSSPGKKLKAIKEQENATGLKNSARDSCEEFLKREYMNSEQIENRTRSPESLGLLHDYEEMPTGITQSSEAGVSGLKKKAKPKNSFFNFFTKFFFSGNQDTNKDDADAEEISLAQWSTD